MCICYFVLNHLRVSCRHDAHLSLNSSICISPHNKGILLFNLSMGTKFRKLTLIQYYYLIHRLYSASPVVLMIFFIAKGKKTALWSFICDKSCKDFLEFCICLLILLWFFSCCAKFKKILFMCLNYMVKLIFLGSVQSCEL